MERIKRAIRSPFASIPLLAVGFLLLFGTTLQAADHTEPPAISNDKAADIADFYAWHDGSGNLVLAVTWGGPAPPAQDQSPTLNRDVLYGLHIDKDDDQKADTDIWVRFAQDADGNWGVKIDNFPGASESVTGAVESELTPAGGSGKAWVGLAEDPFFFDLDGFNSSVMNQSLTDANGDLYFDNSRDVFAGANVTALVLEFPVSEVTGASGVLDIWTTTSLHQGGSS